MFSTDHPFLSNPIHAPQFKKGAHKAYQRQDSLSAGISPLSFSKPNVRIHPTEMHRFFRNLSRSASNEYNPNIMVSNTDKQDLKKKSVGGDQDLTTTSAPSSCSSSRSASPAAVPQAANTENNYISAVNRKNRQKNDRAVEVLNGYSVVIARFRTQTECAKYLQATPEAVSYHCSNPKKSGGVCNGLVIRPCDNSDDDIQFGLFDGAEESRPKKRAQLKPETVALLKQWLLSPEHIDNPYPTANETKMLMQRTGLDKTQLKHWFNNARKRILKPMLEKRKAAGDDSQAEQYDDVVEVVPVKRKEAPAELPKERSSKKKKAKVAAKVVVAKEEECTEDSNNSSGSAAMILPQRKITASPSDLPLSQFGSMFGSERAGVGIVNASSMGMMNDPMSMSFGLNHQDIPSVPMAMMGAMQGSSFGIDSASYLLPQHQESQQQPSPAIFKQQVAAMAMKEANIAFKNMEEAYAMAKEVMAAVQSSSSGLDMNIEDDPRVIEATARAKKLHSVALFKLKVSKRASEEAERAFEVDMML